MRLYLLIALAILVAAVSAEAQTVMVQSGRYADFRQLLSREAPTGSATIAMTLRFPDQARDRSPAVVPAVVIVHTIAGYQEANEGWHADEFRKAGFATLTYSSDAARRLREGGESAGPWASAVAEAYAAFRLLADDPRIDARRIAIVGFSFGGEIALLSAFERFRAALAPGSGEICSACRLLSRGRLRHGRRARRLHGRADPDAVGRQGRQSARGEGAKLSRLCPGGGLPVAHRGVDLSRRVSRLDGFEPRRRRLLPAVPQHAKLSVSSIGTVAADCCSSRAKGSRSIRLSCRPASAKAKATRWPMTPVSGPSPPRRPGFSFEGAAP